MRVTYWLAPVLLVVSAACGSSADLANLKLIPPQANLVVQIDHPRRLLETIMQHDVTKQALQLPFIQQLVDAPGFQRFLQLVRYYEKDLGAPWPELVDKLAGGGLTISTRFGGDGAPAVLFFRGTDEAFTKRFLTRLLDVVEQEQLRTESKERTKKGVHRGVEGWQLAKDALLARIGSTLIFTNKNDALRAVIDVHADSGKSLADRSEIAAARKSLPPDCHAWLWLDLSYAKESKEAKAQFALPSNDALQLFLIGGWANTVFRSPYLLVGLYEEAGNFTLSARLPAGRDGMPEALALHVPPAGKPGTLPLLQPKSALYSQSFYFDVPSIWHRRQLLFNDMLAKQFDDAQKQVGKFLPGTSLSQLLSQAGSHHRIVVVNHAHKSYATQPNQTLPAFAFVTTYRDPKFAKSFEGVLRGAALLATQQFKMQMNDETHDGVKITYYRFDEKAKVDGDPDNSRFNFTPSMAAVQDQFIISSNIELCRELIGLIKKEQRQASDRTSPAAFRGLFQGQGGGDLLRSIEDQILAQVLLDQAVMPDEARKRTQELIDFVRKLGSLELSSTYGTKETRLEASWKRPQRPTPRPAHKP